MVSSNLTRYAWLSIAAAVVTLVLKTIAYWVTDSVGMLSDAMESTVNLAAALMALTMLTIAARPADDDHAFGHSKAEYFSSGVEGALILIAAVSIIWAALPRLMHPQAIEQVGLGLMISLVASAVNFGAAVVLLRAGKKHHSITLEADAHHLMTDVWTSAGVLIGIGAVYATGWLILDPLIAIAVAINIVWTGFQLLRRSVDGLMDMSLPTDELAIIHEIIGRYVTQQGIAYSSLKTRQAGSHKFISVHILVPANWTVQRGHDLLDLLEADIEKTLYGSHVLTHLEPIESPSTHHY
ncbi:MAG: cation diffusion facilitator family transporter [Agitococcus sp.]|nr:cation diffusion facilitator family transporter [Agitococcus sp.]